MGRLQRFAPVVAVVTAGAILLGCDFGPEAQSSTSARPAAASTTAPEVPAPTCPSAADSSGAVQNPPSDAISCGSAVASDSATTSSAVNADIPEGSGVIIGRVERSGRDPRSGAGGTGGTAP